jgi:3-hydroxybutyryl-CoA dehydrogenase
VKHENFDPVAILGIGRMAVGLAIDLALNGCPVDIIDIKPRSSTERHQKTENLQSEFTTAVRLLGRNIEELPVPHYCGDDVPDKKYHYVFEALPEEIPIKQSAYQSMGSTIVNATALCSMTSALTVSELTDGIEVAADLVVTHFMNPPWLIPFLEVVTPPLMPADNVDRLFTFLKRIGHMPIRCKSSPGFVISRLQLGLMNEAVKLMEEGIASPQDIDKAITHGWGYRFPVIGILEFIDVGGLDILYHASQSVARELGRPDLTPPDLVKTRYDQGAYGTKTLRGLFDYGDGADLPQKDAKRLRRQVRLKSLLDSFMQDDEQ